MLALGPKQTTGTGEGLSRPQRMLAWAVGVVLGAALAAALLAMIAAAADHA